MAGIYGLSREAVRVKVKKCEGNLPPEWRKFSVDPQITTLEVLYSILAKAFDLKSDFSISYKAIDPNGQEVYLAVLSDWDLDAAFLRAHNHSISNGTDPCLSLVVEIKPFSEATDWDAASTTSASSTTASLLSSTTTAAGAGGGGGGGGGGSISVGGKDVTPLQQSLEVGQKYVQNMQTRLPGFFMNHMGKTFSMVTRALNFVEDQTNLQPIRPPLSDTEFLSFCDSVGQIVQAKNLRKAIYNGGIEPGLRRVVWKEILNVYPEGMTGKQRMDYVKQKSAEYYRLREVWRMAIQQGPVAGELAYVTGMVRKDVLRTDRLHPFYAGDDDNKNIASLFNILTTYALNHAVSYCQGMSDIASPLLVTMCDEAQAYICFCAIMKRLAPNFMLDGISMTQKFAHLADALQFYDPEFYEYLKLQQADDLLFCYRWLLLEMKREFAFEDSLRMLEVLWSSIPPDPPVGELKLFEKEFVPTAMAQLSPKSTGTADGTVVMRKRETPYSNLCALRRQSSSQSLLATSPSTLNTIDTDPSSSNAAISSSAVGAIGAGGKGLDATKKRFNHSLDENITRLQANNVPSIRKSFQSLDESKLRRQRTTAMAIQSIDLNEKSAVNNFEVKNNEKNQQHQHQQQNHTQKQQTIPTAITTVEVSPNNNDQVNTTTTTTTSTPVTSIKQQEQKHRDEQSTANNNNILSSKTQATNTSTQSGSGHFKGLKDRIAAGKKEIFASLDKIEKLPFDSSSAKSSDNSEESDAPPKAGKIVKNFNEFLNFASKGAKLTLIRSASVNSKDSRKTRSSLRLTKSTHHNLNSNKASEAEDTCRRDSQLPKFNEHPQEQTANKKTLQLQLDERKPTSFDGSSPDDSEYFPMTTSITRELRLELDNLNRQVFGNSFSPKINTNGSNSPEISYKKFNQNSEDDVHLDKIYSIQPATATTTGQLGLDDVTKALKCPSSTSINADVFIWENPLHQLSPTTNAINPDGCSSTSATAHQLTELQQQQQQQQHFDESKNPFYAKDFLQTLTPDEQTELEYDGELIDEVTGKKSITPIRLINRKPNDDNGGSGGGGGRCKNASSSQRNSSYFRTPDSETDSSENSEKAMNNLMKTSMLSETNPFLMDIVAAEVAAANANTAQTTIDMNQEDEFIDEEASEAETVPNVVGGDGSRGGGGGGNDTSSVGGGDAVALPTPNEFGGGNPFLMFLCLSLLLQHRNFVMNNNMDYNEMAMHFDKMVRKHNVVRVLNQARRMYADYLKSQQQQQQHQQYRKASMVTTTTTANSQATVASSQHPINT